MKTKVLMLLLSLACPGRAQDLLDEQNHWMNVIETINFGVYYEFFVIRGDTVIASNEYKKLYRKYDVPESEWEYLYGMRQDSTQKVYFIRRGDDEERLLYDFNLQLQDSFFICNRVDIFVSSIDTVMLLNGELRKRIQFDPGPETWIEGMGSLDGMVANGGTYYCNTTGEAFPFLNCFTEGGEILFHRQFSPYPCLNGTTALQEPQMKSLNLYPNPFSSNVTLVLPDANLTGELFIFSMQGALVDHRVIKGQYTTIHRGDLPGGIYVYQFVSQDGQVLMGRVVVE